MAKTIAFKSSFFEKLIFRYWSIQVSSTALRCVIDNVERSVPLYDITSININGIFGKKLKLTISDKEYQIKVLTKSKAMSIRTGIKNYIHGKALKGISDNPEMLEDALTKRDLIFSEDVYISYLRHRQWQDSLNEAVIGVMHPFFKRSSVQEHQRSQLETIIQFNDPSNESIKYHNERFIKKTQIKCKNLFNNFEAFPLSEEQQRAVIINADRQLLIAAAGSGKSATIVAKGIYLIDQGLATADEILVLAYNKDAQQEIEKRLRDKLGSSKKYTKAITAKTFHGLGLEIIQSCTKKKPAIAEIASAGKTRQLQVFSNLIQNIISQDKVFAKKWNLYHLLYSSSMKNVSSFKTKRDYDNYLLENGGVRRFRKGGGSSIVLPTMDGKEVKSLEELRIANWLIVNGIKYEYEQPYEYDVSDEEHRQYLPDFYYPEAELYHEHFAIDKKGIAPPFFKDYVDGVQWKRKLHKEMETNLIETHSAHFTDGSVLSVLEDELARHGITINPLSDTQLDKLIDDSFADEQNNVFLTFLHHFKMNNLSVGDISKRNKQTIDYPRNALFIQIFSTIYTAYSKALSDLNMIDFEDQIHMAAKMMEDKQYVHQYKYILVDEFQDLSQDRKRLILALLNQDQNKMLFGVGDDWQSIYRFSGADIDLMVNFSDHFGKAEVTHLTKTYRSYQGIVDIASKFIMSNPAQIKKNVTSLSDSESQQVHIVNINDNQPEVIVDLLTKLNNTARENETKLSVFLLSRYKFNIPKNIRELQNYDHLNVQFKTIHASKGLEADYVILINLEAGKYGFPSTLDDDPVLSLVIPKPETYEHSEERRLMYVAITRAKRGVFLLSNSTKESVFTSELRSNA